MNMHMVEVGATRTRSTLYLRFLYSAECDSIVDHTETVSNTLHGQYSDKLQAMGWPARDMDRLPVLIRQRMGYGLKTL